MSRNLPIRQYPYSTYQGRKIGKETDPNRNTRNKKKKKYQNSNVPLQNWREFECCAHTRAIEI